MDLFEKYFAHLAEVRANRSRWKQDFGWGAKDGKSLQRLRLGAALYNDLRPADHDLARFLFAEEVKQKKWYKEHDTEAIRLIGLMLTKFSDPDDFPILCEAHKLDSDFDIKMILSMGVHVVSYYVDTAAESDHTKLLKEALETISPDEVRQFRVEEQSRFAEYTFEPGTEIHVASLLDEKTAIVELLQKWFLHRTSGWTEEDAQFYAYYASGTEFELHAFQSYVSNFNTFGASVYVHRLVNIYVERGECNKAIQLLCSLLAREKLHEDLLCECLRELSDVLIYHQAQGPDAHKAFNLIDAIRNQGNIGAHDRVKRSIQKLIEQFPGKF